MATEAIDLCAIEPSTETYWSRLKVLHESTAASNSALLSAAETPIAKGLLDDNTLRWFDDQIQAEMIQTKTRSRTVVIWELSCLDGKCPARNCQGSERPATAVGRTRASGSSAHRANAVLKEIALRLSQEPSDDEQGTHLSTNNLVN